MEIKVEWKFMRLSVEIGGDECEVEDNLDRVMNQEEILYSKLMKSKQDHQFQLDLLPRLGYLQIFIHLDLHKIMLMTLRILKSIVLGQ